MAKLIILIVAPELIIFNAVTVEDFAWFTAYIHALSASVPAQAEHRLP